MMRFFMQGQPRRKSRRFVPCGIPEGISIEHLEHRIVLDGDITPAVQLLMDQADTDLGKATPSGDETAYWDAFNQTGDDVFAVHTLIEEFRDEFHDRIDAKIQAWTEYKALLQADLVRMKNYAEGAGWPQDWYAAPNAQSQAQKALSERHEKIVDKILDVVDPAMVVLNNKAAMADVVYDAIHDTVELHQQEMSGGGLMKWITADSYAQVEQDLING